VIDDETLRCFAWHPAIERLRQARQAIQQLRKPPLEVIDGRNYFSILPFKAKTSRNSTIGCIFQAPRWAARAGAAEAGRRLAIRRF
jgi:hypothetical protein